MKFNYENVTIRLIAFAEPLIRVLKVIHDCFRLA